MQGLFARVRWRDWLPGRRPDRFHPDRPRREDAAKIAISAVVWDMVKSADRTIVNASDRTLLGGTGIDGAVHRAAGPRMARWIAERRLGNGNGSPVETPGFDLPCAFVVHAAAPIWEADREAALFEDLAWVWFESMRLADANGTERLSTVLLGAGAYGWRPGRSLEALVLAADRFGPYAANLRSIRVFGIGERFRALAQERGLPCEVEDSQAGYDPGFDSVSRIGA